MAKVHKAIIGGIQSAEASNASDRALNPNGNFPICMPSENSIICARCSRVLEGMMPDVIAAMGKCPVIVEQEKRVEDQKGAR